ncbi:hypothetical protein BMS3Bbin02_00326 [bacterium BMS3Bbin02]|nr:hypothetical protein BMS3Bbin02_00326 [bacterium BMS3Bbin02]
MFWGADFAIFGFELFLDFGAVAATFSTTISDGIAAGPAGVVVVDDCVRPTHRRNRLKPPIAVRPTSRNVARDTTSAPIATVTVRTTKAPVNPTNRPKGKAISDPTTPPRSTTCSIEPFRAIAPVSKWNNAREETNTTDTPIVTLA